MIALLLLTLLTFTFTCTVALINYSPVSILDVNSLKSGTPKYIHGSKINKLSRRNNKKSIKPIKPILHYLDQYQVRLRKLMD